MPRGNGGTSAGEGVAEVTVCGQFAEKRHHATRRVNFKHQTRDCIKLPCGRILLEEPEKFPAFGECDVFHRPNSQPLICAQVVSRSVSSPSVSYYRATTDNRHPWLRSAYAASMRRAARYLLLGQVCKEH